MKFLPIIAAIVFILIIVALGSFSFAVGYRTDSVALVNAIKAESTLDEIQQLRQEENGRNPLFLICPTVLIMFAFVVVFNLDKINKTMRTAKSMNPFAKKSRGHRHAPRMTQPELTQYPPHTAVYGGEPQRQLPSGDEHDF